jgi:HEAT repeat protein
MDAERETVLALLRPTHDEEGWYRRVKNLDAAKAIPVLTALVEDGSQPVQWRRMAVLILGLLCDGKAAGTLARALDDPDVLVRGRAAEALGRCGGQGEDVVQHLIARLEDEEAFVRESAAKALGALAGPEALAALGRMGTGDSAENNRGVALQAITAIRSRIG